VQFLFVEIRTVFLWLKLAPSMIPPY
jgi:hypothetical protein